MRLLDVHTRKLVDFHQSDQVPPYAILSHTWGDGEVSFRDVEAAKAAAGAGAGSGAAAAEISNREGWSKVLGTCERARHDGIGWVWVDT
jgi:hypothetical protein